MSGGNPHSHVVFFHPAQPDVNVQLHFYPQGDGVTVLDVLVVYLEPLPKPDGPVIPLGVEQVEIDYLPNGRTHLISEPVAIQRLADIVNGLPVRPDYIHSCPVGLQDSGATLTFISAEGQSWEVRIVHPGCPFRVEFEPYPYLYDTRQLLWEAVQEVIGEKAPHDAGPWPGRPTMPTIPGLSTPTPTPTVTGHGNLPSASVSQIVDANNRFAFDLLAELRQQEGDENLFISPLSIALALHLRQLREKAAPEQLSRQQYSESFIDGRPADYWVRGLERRRENCATPSGDWKWGNYQIHWKACPYTTNLSGCH
jgi:hypothetical protein